jgi:uncharacterized protein
MAFTLITGASSGIGFELAKIFAKNNHDLVLVSRDKAALVEKAKMLHDTYKVKVVVIPKDLSFYNSPKEVYAELKNKQVEVDILVNNAGFGSVGKVWNDNYDNDVQMIGVNVTSLTLLTQLILKDMVEKKKGKILQVSSIAAYLPGEEMAVYYATKAYVSSLSCSIREEIRKTGVTMTTLCPGPTTTGFEKRAGVDFSNWHPMSSEAVAIAGYKGLMKGKKVVIPGFRNKLVVFLSKILPSSVIAFMMRRVE